MKGILTEIRGNDGQNVVAPPIHLNEEDDTIVVNHVSSIYEKNNINNFLETQIKKGNLLYYNKTKSQEWSTSRGLQLPKLVQSNPDSNIILRKGDVVKWYLKNGTASQARIKRNYDRETQFASKKTPEAIRERDLEKYGYDIEQTFRSLDVPNLRERDVEELSQRIRDLTDIVYENGVGALSEEGLSGIKELVENAVLLDTEVHEHHSNNVKNDNIAFDQYSLGVDEDGNVALYKLTIEDYYQNVYEPSNKRFHNLKYIEKNRSNQ